MFLCFNVLMLTACARKGGEILGEKMVRLAGQELVVEIADTPAEWSRGLSGRENLAENSGMLFVYGDYNIRSFWMKGMKFPLDIVWIKDGIVMECEKQVQVLDKNGQISQVLSPSEVNYVLEVNSGICEKYGIVPGVKLEISK